MQGNSEVLVIDDLHARRQQLESLLLFIREPCKVVDSNHVDEALASQSAWRAILIGQIDTSSSVAMLSELALRFKAQPFLLVGQCSEPLPSLPNLMGVIQEPFYIAS